MTDTKEMAKDLEVSQKMAKCAYDALQDRLGQDVTILDIHHVSMMADYFLIATANNSSQMQALVESVQEKLSLSGYDPLHVEGVRDSGWVLLDYGRIIVHIFTKKAREFYDLEHIWSNSPKVDPDQL